MCIFIIYFSESSTNEIGIIKIKIKSSDGGKVDEYPQYPMDEKYNIDIDKSVIILNTNTIYGAIRGLETITQISTPGGINVPYPSTIIDEPEYKWRGLQFDTARHYFPVRTIKKVIDGLGYNKYNVLHWHLTDAVSFPLYIPKYPDLASKTSYNNQIYTENDIKEIVNYAKLRGIRVVPEVDSPAHTAALYKYDPKLIVECHTPDFSKYKEVDKFVLNPLYSKTTEIWNAIYDYIIEIFPDNYVHLGGDEINKEYWSCSKELNNYARSNRKSLKYYIVYYSDVLKDYLIQMSTYVESKNKKVLFWEGAYDSGAKFNKNIGKESWKCWSSIGERSFAQGVREGRPSIQATYNIIIIVVII